MALTPKQEMFVKEYLVDLNATQAAIRAGYSEKTANVIGPENLAKPCISVAIQEAMDKRKEVVTITAQDVLLELRKLGFGNIKKLYGNDGKLIPVHELPDDVAATITEVKERVISSDGENVVIDRQYKVADKRAALVDIGKHIGMFDHKTKDVDVTDWDKVCRAMAEAVAQSEKP